jgi:hypothetical protein
VLDEIVAYIDEVAQEREDERRRAELRRQVEAVT